MNNSLVYKELSFEIVGILFEVHNELGRYCNEKQYGDLLEKKLKEKNIKYKRELIIPESFDGERKGRNKIDFIIENKVIIEMKCKRYILKDDYYQVQRYLRAYNKKLGFLVNFRDSRLNIKRILNSDYYN